MCIYIYYTHTYTILIQLYVYMYSINTHVQWTCIICISLSLYLSLSLSIYLSIYLSLSLYIYIYIYAYHKWMSTFAMSPTWWQHYIFLTIKSLQRSAAQATSSCGVTRIPGIQRGKLHLDLTFKATDFTRWIVPKILIFAYLCLERCELYLPR